MNLRSLPSPLRNALDYIGASQPFALIAVLVLMTGLNLYNFLRPSPRPTATVVTRVDTVAAARWKAEADSLRKETDRLRLAATGQSGKVQHALAVAQGITVRPPTHVTVSDSAVAPSAPQVVVDGSGKLTVSATVPDSAGVVHGVTATGINVSDCDDGFRLDGTTTICNRARLGHLRLFVGLGAQVSNLALPVPAPVLEGGVEWRPSFRSAHSVELRGNQNGVTLEGRVGVRLF